MRVFLGLLCVFGLLNENRSVFAQESRSDSRSASHAAIVGNWEWMMQMGLMRKKMEAEFNEKAGGLQATMVAPDGTKLESKDFFFKNNRVKFSVSREMGPQMSFTMTFDGTLKADRIDGTIQMSGGPMNQTLPWKASRVVKKNSPASPNQFDKPRRGKQD